MDKLRLLYVMCFCLFSAFTRAGTITYNGSDLFNNPNISFPTTTPTLDGASLIFEGSTPGPHKLLTLPLFSAGTLSTISPTIVSITINFTRLGCLTSVGCAGNTVDDSDHVILLGDGSNLVGGVASDGASDGFDGAGTILEYTDLGNTADLHSSLNQIVFTNVGYPAIGSSFDVNMLLTLDATSNVDLSFLGGSGSAGGFIGLDRTAAIDFVFLSEGDPGEQYQINSLTFISDTLIAVPIPPAIYLFSSGLLGLIGIVRKKAD